MLDYRFLAALLIAVGAVIFFAIGGIALFFNAKWGSTPFFVAGSFFLWSAFKSYKNSKDESTP